MHLARPCYDISMEKKVCKQELAKWLARTGRAHHEAFTDALGYDPEWASWYADYLIEHAPWEELCLECPEPSHLSYLLTDAGRENYGLGAWEEAYASYLVNRLSPLDPLRFLR